MKKILSFFLAGIICISFAGCSKNGKKINAVTTGISFTAEISHQEQTFEYAVDISKNGKCEIQPLKSGEPSGLKVTFENKNILFSFLGLEYKTTLSSLADGLIIDFLYRSFSELPANTPIKTDDDVFYIENSTDKYNCKIYFGETGLPLKITEKNFSITAIIKNIQIKKE